jgi:ketosteroid isomerase-like protein
MTQHQPLPPSLGQAAIRWSARRAASANQHAALQAGDEQTIRDSFAEDATWTLRAGDLPLSGTWRGRGAIIDEFLAGALSHYEPGSIELEVTGMLVEDERIALQWTTRARTRDGQSYENDCIGMFTVKDGKIHAVREYMDTLYASQRAYGGITAGA